MIEDPNSKQLIIDCLNTNYSIKLTRLSLLHTGADINASVYKGETKDKSSYFIKLKQGHYSDISATLISLLHDAGIQEIIPPTKANDGEPIQHLNDYTLIVSPFIEGQDGFSKNLSNDQWITLGKVMRKIHEINVPPFLQLMLRHEDYSSKYRDMIRPIYDSIESERSTDEISLKYAEFMKKNAAVIYRLVDRAGQLAKRIQAQVPEFVLCHSDIHAGNVLMNNNDSIYIVDWDAPIMAPKERDLMFIGGGVANIWNKPHEEQLFYKGYGVTEIKKALLAYYRHERIVEDIAEYGQQLLLISGDYQNRLASYKHFIAQFEPYGVVDIAFKTDE